MNQKLTILPNNYRCKSVIEIIGDHALSERLIDYPDYCLNTPKMERYRLDIREINVIGAFSETLATKVTDRK